MSSLALHFRPAQAGDADACAPLIFASGVHEFGFFLDQPDQPCIAFLRLAFASNHGRYSWRRHYVACSPDGAVLCEIAAHEYGHTTADDLHLTWMLLRFFGPLKTPGMLVRGSVIETELPPPNRGQTLLTNLATDPRMRGQGICTAMLAHALASGWLLRDGGQCLLDVRLDNPDARRLYERLGFIAQPRPHPPSVRLPSELVSMRMVWSAQGMAALRESIASSQKPVGQTDPPQNLQPNQR
jgi:ribosomal protein S18 acetylase RimI-like enzyme